MKKICVVGCMCVFLGGSSVGMAPVKKSETTSDSIPLGVEAAWCVMSIPKAVSGTPENMLHFSTVSVGTQTDIKQGPGKLSSVIADELPVRPSVPVSDFSLQREPAYHCVHEAICAPQGSRTITIPSPCLSEEPSE